MTAATRSNLLNNLPVYRALELVAATGALLLTG